MTNDPKIVVIGAGSSNFSLVTLNDLLQQSDLQQATLCLVDINEEALSTVYTLALKLKEYHHSSIEIISTTDRKKILDNADFVILSIAERREETWKRDFEIAKKFDIWHYAENGGPGAFGHTVRNIALCMPIFYDIHDFAPNSWLINFTNPLPRIHYAAKDYTNLSCISFCHQFWHGHFILGKILAHDLGIQTNSTASYLDYRMAALQEYEVTAAGLNHFTWMLKIHRKETGDDLYPLLWREIDKVPSDFEALTIHVFRTFGLFPVPGETHLSEYLPYTAKKENWDKYHLYPYNFKEGKENRIRDWNKIKNMINGKLSFDNLKPNPSERIVNIISEIFSDSNAFESAINIENNGAISNLPNDAVVEVPCIVNRSGAMGQKVGALPEAIAGLCAREISIAKLITKSAVQGDRNLAIQAFALDPMINDILLAEKLVDEYLEAFRPALSYFFQK
ncbi:MAG: family 4 glycosyl hydrolase [Candidatus Hodarchaeales archaeon]